MTVNSFEFLAPHYDRLWQELVPTPEKVPALQAICQQLIMHKASYEEVSQRVWATRQYWWYVAITDQMEGGGGAHTYLGNGQRLDRVTTEVPAGRGPFASFVDGACDALKHVPPPVSIAKAAYNFEGYNGWGYLNKPIEDPYLAAQSNKYTSGKYIADHVYDPNSVSQQPGALTILKVLVGIDPTIIGANVETTSMGPHDPLPPQKSKPISTEPDVVQTKEGHTMVDVTVIEKEVDVGLIMLERLLPLLSYILGSRVTGYITQAIAGVRAIEAALNVPPHVALVEATNHVTPGAPNSPVLSQGKA